MNESNAIFQTPWKYTWQMINLCRKKYLNYNWFVWRKEQFSLWKHKNTWQKCRCPHGIGNLCPCRRCPPPNPLMIWSRARTQDHCEQVLCPGLGIPAGLWLCTLLPHSLRRWRRCRCTRTRPSWTGWSWKERHCPCPTRISWQCGSRIPEGCTTRHHPWPDAPFGQQGVIFWELGYMCVIVNRGIDRGWHLGKTTTFIS